MLTVEQINTTDEFSSTKQIVSKIITEISDISSEIKVLEQKKEIINHDLENLFDVCIKQSKLCKILYKTNDPDELIEWRNQTNKLNMNQIKIQDYMDKINDINSEIKELKNFVNVNKDWQGGKCFGDIIDIPDGCRIRFDEQSRSFKFQNYKKSDTTIICESKEDCLIKAKKYLYDYYNNLGKIANQYRFIHPKYIEVKLPNGLTFITNSKFIDLIEQNKISSKHDKRYDMHYVMYLSGPKEHSLFYKLMNKFTKVKYINDCTLDVREENLEECDNEVLLGIKKIENTNIQTDNLKEKLNKDGYPYNKWILGKYAGTVFQRSNKDTWSVVLKKEDGSVVTKTYTFNQNNKQELYEKAVKVKNDLSDSLGLTKNRIKILDDNTIEVELSKSQTMKTDYKFLKLIQDNPLYVSKSQGENEKYYAGMIYNNQNKLFHNVITGYDMVDHIDRNPLNNCLSNLRETDYKLNNNNRSKSESSNAIVIGVTFCEKDQAFKARIKQNNVEVSKQFSIKKYGYEMAKQLAIEARQNYNQMYNCNNG